MEFVLDEGLTYGVRPDAAAGVRKDAGVVVDAKADTDACAELCEDVCDNDDANVDLHLALDADVDAMPVPVSGRFFNVNELKAMAIVEAVHSGKHLQHTRQFQRRDGIVVEVDTLWNLARNGLLEDYCLAFACDALGDTRPALFASEINN